MPALPNLQAILRIWRAVFIVTTWSIVVAVADIIYGKQLGLTNNVGPPSVFSRRCCCD